MATVNRPLLHFPENLPICARRADIAQAIQVSQVVIVCGETGSGKTTQLSKICLSLGRGLSGPGQVIGHTQPRRLAAIATAKRIAHELGSVLGAKVGYRVRFQDKLSPDTCIKLMTDGILLAETQSDPLLTAYDTLIIDEAHERSLNIDFLLGYLKQLLPRRPDLKLIITSATIDAQRFAEHLANLGKPAPVLEVSGRLYPVEIRYRPIAEEKKAPTQEKKQERDLYDAIIDAVDELCRVTRDQLGDILIFLPGEREIREAAQALRAHQPAHTEILPLFARLSVQEQEKIFRPQLGRRIVLATNVAETSLTVPGIRYVIDSGLARVKRYSYRNKVEQLQIENIAQSSANQRAGRCGRLADGICIRLYDEADFLARPRFPDPEIFRSSLAAVILRMHALGLGQVESFPFLESPPNKALHDGYQLLQELGAIDSSQQLTKIGQQLSRLPLDPRVGRLLIAAHEYHCLREVIVIASALSLQDPRERPLELQAEADQAHKQFTDSQSEFLTFIKIWDWFSQALHNKKSQRQLQAHCRQHFLSYPRLREWRDIHDQLSTVVHEHQWRMNASAATYEQVHLALLTGLLGNIGYKAEGVPHYLGARAIKFFLWPGSTLGKKAGRWVMAAELVETTQLFARTVARIQPEWIEKVAPHLIRKNITDPHWEKKAGQVLAFERGILYGLTIYQNRRVDFARIDPAQARALFIRRALVEEELDQQITKQLPFIQHNQKLIREIEALEHTARRQDVLVNDDLIYDFYDQQLAQHITSSITLLAWHKQADDATRAKLFLKREALMRHEATHITSALYPKIMTFSGIDMVLEYHFEPGSTVDGITLTVPIYALNQVDGSRCEWLVPGMLKEKIQQLLKSLPQKWRRHCVPLGDYATGFCQRVSFAEGELITALIDDLRDQLNLRVTPNDFKTETLANYLFMNFKIVDEYGAQLDSGRNLHNLRTKLGQQARQQFREAFLSHATASPKLVETTLADPTTQAQTVRESQFIAKKLHADECTTTTQKKISTQESDCLADNAVVIKWDWNQQKITDWCFDTLPELLELQRDHKTLFGYPALVDKTTHCEIDVFDDPHHAQTIHYQGMQRLFRLQLKEQIKFLEKNIPELQKMAMYYLPLGTQEGLRNQIIQAALNSTCLTAPLPQDSESFKKRIEEGRARLNLVAQEIARLVLTILLEFSNLQKKLPQLSKSAPLAYADIQTQLQNLLNKNFIVATPKQQLTHLPRYLKGIMLRIEKLRTDPARDTARMSEFMPLYRNWQRSYQQQQQITVDPRLEELRWLLEELRIALFAQELRTPMPVSVKRLEKFWASLQT
jgi:ATP-dependent helicase HrpA